MNQSGRLVIAVESSEESISIAYSTELYQTLVALNPEESIRLIFAADVNVPSSGQTVDVVGVIVQRTCAMLSVILEQEGCRCVIVPGLFQCHRFASTKDERLPSKHDLLLDNDIAIEPDMIFFIAKDQDDPVVARFLRLASQYPFKTCVVLMSHDPLLIQRMIDKISQVIASDEVLDQTVWVPVHA